MRLAHVATLALLTLTALAGCSDDKGGGEPATEEGCDLEPVLCDPEHYLANHHCIVNDVRPRVYAPDTPGPDTQADPWDAGDWWRYRITIDGESHDTLLVYYEDIDFDSAGRAQHYLVGTSDPAEALDHALFSVNPMLGRIHRTLYSPHESGLHADMFNFPLCQGATWTTDFYGTTFDLAASAAHVALPGGGNDGLAFSILGGSGDGSRLLHTYSPQAKWFTRIELDRADGLQLDMELLDFGSGQTGQYYFLRAQKDEELDLGALQQGSPALVGREDGGEGAYNTVGVWADLQRQGSGKVEVLLRDPSGVVRACIGLRGEGSLGALRAGCIDATGGTELKLQAPYSEGDWAVALEKNLLDPTTVSGEMRLVSIYDRSGTV